MARKQVEQTGHDLAQEFDVLVADLAARTEERQQVVRARLSALESEDRVLAGLNQKLNG